MSLALRLIKWLVYGLLGFFVLASVLYCVLFAINFKDEPPSDKYLHFERIINRPPPSDAPTNALVGIWGLGLADGSDLWSGGQAEVDRLRALGAWELAKDFGGEGFESPLESNEISFDAGAQAYFSRCNTRDNQCDDVFLNIDAEDIISSNSAVLSRYHELLNATYSFRSYPMTVTSPLPYYSPALRGQKLYFLNIVSLSAELSELELNTQVNRDFLFWRLFLRQADTLIGKMIAVAGLRNHFVLANQLDKILVRSGSHQLLPPGWLEPFTQEGFSLGLAMAGEIEFGLSALEEAHDTSVVGLFGVGEGSWYQNAMQKISTPFLKRQATINRFSSSYFKVAEASSRFPSRNVGVELDRAEADDPNFLFGVPLYNPLGYILAMVGAPAFDTYIYRAADVEGYRLCALATFALREKNETQGVEQAWLNQAQFKNPMDGEPFVFQKKEHAVGYKRLNKGEPRMFMMEL